MLYISQICKFSERDSPNSLKQNKKVQQNFQFLKKKNVIHIPIWLVLCPAWEAIMNFQATQKNIYY